MCLAIPLRRAGTLVLTNDRVYLMSFQKAAFSRQAITV